MTEAELAVKFIAMFDGFDIFQEVPGGGGIIDFVAVVNPYRVAVEVKCALNFEVIWQAYQAKAYAHYAYAAVPVKYNLHPAQYELCKHLGVGVLAHREVGWYPARRGMPENPAPKYKIEELLKPQLNRKPSKLTLADYMKRSVAGSQNGRITAFGYFVECLEEIVRRHPKGIGPKALFEAMDNRHYRTLSAFRSSVVKYCNA